MGKLRVGEAGDLCLALSEPNNAFPVTDVAHNATVSASSTWDQVAHAAMRAVDGDSSTYWASGPVSGSDPVTFAVSLPRSNVESIDIEWEIPPASFDLLASEDGQHWSTWRSVHGNPSHSVVSHISIGGRWCK